MKRFLTIVFSVIITSVAWAQNSSVNSYKYVVVDNQYEWQSKANQNRQNELMVFLLEKYGFTVVRSNQVLPTDLNRGTCNALALKTDKSGTFRVNLDVWLEDCDGNKLFTTKTGIGRTKDYRIAYNEAIRDAFESFEELEYEYDPQAINTNEIASSIKSQPVENRSIIVINDEPDEDVENAVVEVTDTMISDYSNQEMQIIFNDAKTAFDIIKSYKRIGYGRKTAAGSFVVYTNSFNGIAYLKDDVMIVEYDNDRQEPQIIILNKSL